VRKGVAAYLATLLAQELPHRRILELYANLVEFGPGIWGACAASWYYFGTSVSPRPTSPSISRRNWWGCYRVQRRSPAPPAAA
jgi:hypothetical protein